jgi:molybdopterin/thiamine biosynthesis adenylyltransferase
MHPRLKDVFWRRRGAELNLVYGAREQLRLDDRDGTVELLLDLLRTGRRTPGELAFTVGTPIAAVEQLIGVLDQHRLLVDDDRARRVGDFLDRHAVANSFFVPHATLEVAAYDMLERMHVAHVLVLGVGEVGIEVAAQLTALGVGQLTVADARLGGGGDIPGPVLAQRSGDDMSVVQRVVARAGTINPSVLVVGVEGAVSDAAMLGALLDRHGPDVLVADLGRAGGVDLRVNASCVDRLVPFTCASIGQTGALIYSVDPGHSACLACVCSGPAAAQDARAVSVLYERPSPALCIPPVAGLVSSLVVLEVLRYVTGFEPPAYANQPMHIEFAAGGSMHRLAWRRDRSCPACCRAAVRIPSIVDPGQPDFARP